MPVRSTRREPITELEERLARNKAAFRERQIEQWRTYDMLCLYNTDPLSFAESIQTDGLQEATPFVLPPEPGFDPAAREVSWREAAAAAAAAAVA